MTTLRRSVAGESFSYRDGDSGRHVVPADGEDFVVVAEDPSAWLSNSGWLSLVCQGRGAHMQANAGKTNTKGMPGCFSLRRAI